MSDSFTSQLWQGITEIYRAVLAHPFLTGLTDGSLPHDAFAFYVVQDALYLRRYADALATVASRAPDTAGTEMFARHAAGAVAVEQALHGSLLAGLGVEPATVGTAEPAPATLAYTSHLLATISGGSYADGVGAVLPCYWIYWEVGKELLRRGSPDPRYQRWIDMYGGKEFGDVVQEVLVVADGLGHGLAPIERASAPALPHVKPLRMNVLGHGLPEGTLASLMIEKPNARRPGPSHSVTTCSCRSLVSHSRVRFRPAILGWFCKGLPGSSAVPRSANLPVPLVTFHRRASAPVGDPERVKRVEGS